MAENLSKQHEWEFPDPGDMDGDHFESNRAARMELPDPANSDMVEQTTSRIGHEWLRTSPSSRNGNPDPGDMDGDDFESD